MNGNFLTHPALLAICKTLDGMEEIAYASAMLRRRREERYLQLP
jgi:hypothetical protein